MVITIYFVGILIVPLCRDLTYDYGEERRQAELICKSIQADPGKPTVYSLAHRGCVDVDIYKITEQVAQDRIIALITVMKERGELDRAVHLRFYERENLIKTPKNEKGISGEHRGPEVLLRRCDL